MLIVVANASETTLIEQVQQRLTTEFPGVDTTDVQTAVQRAHSRFDSSPIRDFVPLFVERHARTELGKLLSSAS